MGEGKVSSVPSILKLLSFFLVQNLRDTILKKSQEIHHPANSWLLTVLYTTLLLYGALKYLATFTIDVSSSLIWYPSLDLLAYVAL
jgi:hypothetical protein